MTEPRYHLALGGQQLEGLTAIEVRTRLAADPRGAAGALVWAEGWEDWRPASSLPRRIAGRRWLVAQRFRHVILGIAVSAAVVLAVVGFRKIRHPSPSSVAEDLLPVLTDYAATVRASDCADLLAQREEFRAAKPIETEKVGSGLGCRAVARGKVRGLSPGGFVLEFGECDLLGKEVAEGAERHEGNLNSKIGLSCGWGQTPTLVPSDSVELRARELLREHVPTVVKGIAEETLTANFDDCYFEMKEVASATYREEQKMRCQVLTAHQNAAGITYEAMWRDASIYDDLDAYKKANETAWKAAEASDTLLSVLDAFTTEMKTKACAAASPTSTDYAAERSAVETALRTCL